MHEVEVPPLLTHEATALVAALLREDVTSIPWRSMTDLCHLTDFSLGALRICIGLLIEARAKADLQMHATLSEHEHLTARNRKRAHPTTVDSLDPYKLQGGQKKLQMNGGSQRDLVDSHLPMFDDKGLLLLELGPLGNKLSTGGLLVYAFDFEHY